MSAFLEFKLDAADVNLRLRQARERGQDLRPALRSVARAGVTQTRRRFQSGVGPDGRSWKKSRKPSGQTLIASGLLLRSISDRPPTANSVEWGSNRTYAAIHQFGGTIVPRSAKALRFRIGGNGGWVSVKKVTMPARPYLGINLQDLSDFSQIMLRHVGGPLTGEAGA